MWKYFLFIVSCPWTHDEGAKYLGVLKCTLRESLYKLNKGSTSIFL